MPASNFDQICFLNPKKKKITSAIIIANSCNSCKQHPKIFPIIHNLVSTCPGALVQICTNKRLKKSERNCLTEIKFQLLKLSAIMCNFVSTCHSPLKFCKVILQLKFIALSKDQRNQEKNCLSEINFQLHSTKYLQ